MQAAPAPAGKAPAGRTPAGRAGPIGPPAGATRDWTPPWPSRRSPPYEPALEADRASLTSPEHGRAHTHTCVPVIAGTATLGPTPPRPRHPREARQQLTL